MQVGDIIMNIATFQNIVAKPVHSIMKIVPFLWIHLYDLYQQIVYFIQYSVCVSIVVLCFIVPRNDAAHCPPHPIHFSAFNHLFWLADLYHSLFCSKPGRWTLRWLTVTLNSKYLKSLWSQPTLTQNSFI